MGVVFRKILVPIDFSEPSKTALHYARELALQSGAELHLVHVGEDPMLLAGWPALAVDSATEIGEEAAAIREQLTQLLTTDDRARIKSGVHVIVGQPVGLAISRFATEGEFELIVIGTHGRGGLTHILMGSVAEQVVRSAPCPVLTIRHPTHRKAAVERLRADAAKTDSR
ncbi:MAG TPA: universal stress protein [Vicinamibacterales bacterium]|nr:universal stress protein [Vicinamibacterales bacterium]